MALKDLFDATVEPFDHAVSLGRHRRCQAVVDIEGCAQRVELVPAGCGGPAQAEEAIRELLAIARREEALFWL